MRARVNYVLAAFDLLDSKALIPPIFCGASELYRLPSLSLDPVSEQVQDNAKALLSLLIVLRRRYLLSLRPVHLHFLLKIQYQILRHLSLTLLLLQRGHR